MNAPTPESAEPSTVTTDGAASARAVDDSTSSTASAKADVGTRVVAVLIDSVIAFILTAIPAIGALIAAAYWIVRDGLDIQYMNGRSVGKHVMGLKPVRLDGKKMDIETSFWRNWMFGLGGVVAFVNMLPFGWFFSLILAGPLALVGIAIVLYETFKVITDSEGRRWGDSLANTKVIKSDA